MKRVLALLGSPWTALPTLIVCLAANLAIYNSIDIKMVKVLSRPSPALSAQQVRDERTKLVRDIRSEWQTLHGVLLLTCLAGLFPLMALFRYQRHISERRAAEQALRASEKRFRELFENVFEGVYQTSPDGMILAANPALIRMLGYESEDELRALDVARDIYIRPEDRRNTLKQYDYQGRLRNVEIRLRRKDGAVITALENSRTVTDSEGGLYYEGTLTDITELKEAERERLRYTEELEQARVRLEEQHELLMRQSEQLIAARDAALAGARLKSEFLANVSHEIRTPMNGIFGMTALLLETPMTDEQRDYATTVRRSADYLLAIINDILDSSKLEAGRFTLQPSEFSLHAVVEDAVEALADAAERKDLELLCRVEESAPDAVYGDPARLRQILTNLVGNAIKFTEAGMVYVHCRQEAADEESTLLRFEVADTGMGIAVEAQQRLFQPFSQVDGSSTRRHGGTGLGLAISRQLTEMMGGEIGVDSCPGKGSSFWFTARLRKGAAASLVEPPSPTGSVLLVDDHRESGACLRETLEQAGWRVELTSGPLDALMALSHCAPDAVIIDLRRGGLGVDLARQIAAKPGAENLPVILLTKFGHRRLNCPPNVIARLTRPARQTQLLGILSGLSGSNPIAGCLVRLHSEVGSISPEPVENRQARILVADDHLVNQKVALRLIGRLGHEAVAVSNGREAVEALAAQEYDLIFMDCQMPEMDGFTATREIRRRESGNGRSIVIAMTAHAMDGDRDRCLAAGMDDYISKPIKSEDLDRIIARWLTPTPSSTLKLPALT